MTTTNPSSPPCHLWKQLPETILITHILPFLPKDNHNSYPLLETNHDFLSLKRQHQSLQLNEKHSLEYLLNLKGYRERVHCAVKDTRRQLDINCTNFPLDDGEVWRISPIQSICRLAIHVQGFLRCDVENASYVSIGSHLVSFDGRKIERCYLNPHTSYHNLRNPFVVVEKISLSHCKSVLLLSLKNICSLILTDIDRLEIWRSEFKDVHLLAEIPNLKFRECQFINDLSSLGQHQEKVHLVLCPLITNVRMLSNVKDFELSNCPLVTELPAFNQAKSISLTGYKGKDIQIIRMAEHVCFKYCPSLSDLNLLSRNLLSLDISGCVQIESIPLFPLLQSLAISECYRIKSLPALTNLTFLDVVCSVEFPSQLSSGLDGLIGLKNLTVGDVTHLSYFEDFLCSRALDKLSYSGSGFSFTGSYTIKELSLQLNDYEKIIVSIPIKSLYVLFCDRLKSIEVNISLGNLKVYDCNQLTQLKLFSYVGHCEVDSCLALSSVTYMWAPGIFRAKNCPNLKKSLIK